MGNISFLQIIIIIMLFALIFGDFPKITNTIKNIAKKIIKIKNRKKGS